MTFEVFDKNNFHVVPYVCLVPHRISGTGPSVTGRRMLQGLHISDNIGSKSGYLCGEKRYLYWAAAECIYPVCLYAQFAPLLMPWNPFLLPELLQMVTHTGKVYCFRQNMSCVARGENSFIYQRFRLYSVVQQYLHTKGNMLNSECQVTLAPLCIRWRRR